MIDLYATCPECGEIYAKHRFVHPRPVKPQFRTLVLCPLCGGKMHRKGLSDTTEFECAWRQWAIATGRLDPKADPKSPKSGDVPRTTPDLLLAFAEWRSQNPDIEAGEVPASRILRQRERAEAERRASMKGKTTDGRDGNSP